MSLPMRPLGASGLEITVVGLGTWALGGGGWSFGWGPQDDDRSIDTVKHAVELGVNWIDTAAVYGHGHCEEVIGRALRALPATSRPLIFTKCGLVWDDAHPMLAARRVVTPETVRRGAEDSLRRLGVDYLDLFQIHWPDATDNRLESAWEEMVRLRDEGVALAVGVCNFPPELLDRCEVIGHVDSVQPPFSLIRRRAAAHELPWAQAHNAGVLCYSPMESGILNDTFSTQRVAGMTDDDWRKRAAAFNEPALSRNLALRDALLPIAARHDCSVAEVALAWVIAWPGVTAIAGARSPQQVDGWIGAADVALTEADIGEIASALEKTGAGGGPAYVAGA
jgi:aryl-alcohol dehydrogenase-like predicted oxidoreductase